MMYHEKLKPPIEKVEEQHARQVYAPIQSPDTGKRRLSKHGASNPRFTSNPFV